MKKVTLDQKFEDEERNCQRKYFSEEQSGADRIVSAKIGDGVLGGIV